MELSSFVVGVEDAMLLSLGELGGLEDVMVEGHDDLGGLEVLHVHEVLQAIGPEPVGFIPAGDAPERQG